MNICLYHGIDLDGFCSGAIYAKAMREADEREWELIPANYGWDLPWEKFEGADVTLIDFSIQPAEDFLRLAELARSVTWIDHHKSAITEMAGYQFGDQSKVTEVLDTNRAGCELAWAYYFGDELIPETVHMLGRYDVWDHTDEDVLPYQYGMRLYNLDPATGDDRHMWGTILSDDAEERILRIHEGATVLRYQTREDEIGARAGCFTVEWEGLLWLAANKGGRGSKFFDSVWDASEFDGMMSFSWNGEAWTFGLYTDKPEIDCGAIAKRYGGGGHPGAAGFRDISLPFDLGLTKRLNVPD